MMERLLGAIERGGNRMPSPAILFVWLCVGVVVLSAVLSWADISVTYQVAKPPPVPVEEYVQGGSTQPSGGLPDASVQEGEYKIVEQTAAIQSLISADGIRFMFTSFVANFRNFAAVAIILVVMIGVGLAESSGLIGSLIRKLVAATSAATLTPILVFTGVLSSIASDAGYLVLIPLGAAAFKSVGRNPLAGMAAAFAGVAAGFGVNFLITPLDGVLTEITNDAIALGGPDELDRSRREPLLRHRLDDLRHHRRVASSRCSSSSGASERHDPAGESDDSSLDADQGVEVSPEADARGLKYALLATVAVLVAITLLTVFPDAPLRDPVTGSIIGDSPFMDSLILIITLVLLRRRARVRAWCGDDQGQRRRDRVDHEVVGRSRRAALPVPADRPVHRVLQLQQHGAGRGGESRRLARVGKHRRALVADRLRLRDGARQLHHAPGDREMGDLSPRSSSRCSSASTLRRRPSSRPTGSATLRRT